MQFLLLIHVNGDAMRSRPPEEMATIGPAMDRFDQEISDRGQNIGSIRLGSAETSRIVRVRKGEASATDGPLSAAEEQLSGVYIIEATDMEEAANIAARLPTATFSTIEVRPVVGIDLRRPIQAY